MLWTPLGSADGIGGWLAPRDGRPIQPEPSQPSERRVRADSGTGPGVESLGPTPPRQEWGAPAAVAWESPYEWYATHPVKSPT